MSLSILSSLTRPLPNRIFPPQRRVLQVDKNVTAFAALYGRHMQYYGGPDGKSGTVYEALPGHRLPQRHASIK